MPGVEPPEPTRLGEVPWLSRTRQPLEAVIDLPPGPERRYEQAESISLAFVTALQLLPPRQLAVLVLRDVLGFRASEVAEMLGCTVESVNSALKRARAGLEKKLARVATVSRHPPRSPSEEAIVAKFVAAYESSDLDSLVALLTDEVFISMPPLPFEYEGREPASRFFASIFGSGRRSTSCRREPTVSQRSAPTSRLDRHRPRRRPVRPHARGRSDHRNDPL